MGVGYADFEYYAEVYGGELDADAFARASIKACRYIDTITLNKAQNAHPSLATDLANCCCALTDELHMQQQTGGTDIASESNDGVSVTYRDNRGSPEQRLQGIAMQFLAATGLMYAGCL